MLRIRSKKWGKGTPDFSRDVEKVEKVRDI